MSDPSAPVQSPATIPLPAPLQSAAGTPFVGRGEALARLEASLATAVSTGQRRTTLIAGEPGIGKTRLAAQFCASAHSAG